MAPQVAGIGLERRNSSWGDFLLAFTGLRRGGIATINRTEEESSGSIHFCLLWEGMSRKEVKKGCLLNEEGQPALSSYLSVTLSTRLGALQQSSLCPFSFILQTSLLNSLRHVCTYGVDATKGGRSG